MNIMPFCIHVNILKSDGYEVTYLDVDENGVVDPKICRSGDQTGYDIDLGHVCEQ